MEALVENQENAPHSRSRVRLLGAALFGVWALYLSATRQIPANFVIAAIALLVGASYFPRNGEPGQRRGSFLIAGALLFCAYFVVIFVFVGGGACIGRQTCTTANMAANVVLTVVGLASAGAAFGEILQGLRPSSGRARWTRRFAMIAIALFVGLVALGGRL